MKSLREMSILWDEEYPTFSGARETFIPDNQDKITSSHFSCFV